MPSQAAGRRRPGPAFAALALHQESPWARAVGLRRNERPARVRDGARRRPRAEAEGEQPDSILLTPPPPRGPPAVRAARDGEGWRGRLRSVQLGGVQGPPRGAGGEDARFQGCVTESPGCPTHMFPNPKECALHPPLAVPRLRGGTMTRFGLAPSQDKNARGRRIGIWTGPSVGGLEMRCLSSHPALASGCARCTGRGGTKAR